MNYRDLHPRQIPTTFSIIKKELFEIAFPVINALLKCFTCDISSNLYVNYLISASYYFEKVSCLVYKSNGGKYKKLKEENYKKELFDGFAGTPEEVYEMLNHFDVSAADCDDIYKMIWQIADLVCPMIACISEQAFISEYAYAIDYVIRHKGNLPTPEIDILFPKNYKDYKYWEGPLIDKIKTFTDMFI